MNTSTLTKLPFASAVVFAAAAASPFTVDFSKGGLAMKAAFAKHGADDPIGHNAGDDRGRRHGGRAADDLAGHR